MTSYPHIESKIDICAGQPHISRTRVTVSLIARDVEQLRMSAERLSTHTLISPRQVHAALAYFYDHRSEIESAMREADDIEADLRARFPSRIQELLASK